MTNKQPETDQKPIRIKISGELKEDEHGFFYSTRVFDAETGRQLDNVTAIEFCMTGEQAFPEVKVTILSPDLDIVCDINQTKVLLEKSDTDPDCPGMERQD